MQLLAMHMLAVPWEMYFDMISRHCNTSAARVSEFALWGHQFCERQAFPAAQCPAKMGAVPSPERGCVPPMASPVRRQQWGRSRFQDLSRERWQ
jgi:hypothetical protein